MRFLICTDVAARGIDIGGLPFGKLLDSLYCVLGWTMSTFPVQLELAASNCAALVARFEVSESSETAASNRLLELDCSELINFQMCLTDTKITFLDASSVRQTAHVV